MAAFHPERQLLRARPPRARRPVQPGRQQRLQRRAPAQLQQRRARRSPSASRPSPATAPRTTAASTGRCATTSAASPTDSVGGTTYGGTGVYGAQLGGVWDALLGEGRNWWFFASSDWHNRGSFGPDDRRTTQDFYPGEYQRNYTLVRNGSDKLRPQTIVDGLRTGNSFATSGQIIDRLGFVACVGTRHRRRSMRGGAAGGERGRQQDRHDRRAAAPRWARSWWCRPARTSSSAIAVRDPAGTNYSPYTFANPSLLQVGINQPLNMPVLDHIDLIRGLVTGYKTPGAPDYAGEWPRNTNWLQADGTTADLSVVPAAAKNSRRDHQDLQRQRRHGLDAGDLVRRRQHVPDDDVPHPGGRGLAVRAAARHQPAGRGAVRDRRQRQPAGRRLHQRAGHRRGCASRAPRRTARAASSTAARTTWRRRPAPTTRSSARRRCRSTSRPGPTSGSTATRSTSRSPARRVVAGVKYDVRRRTVTISSAPRGDARRRFCYPVRDMASSAVRRSTAHPTPACDAPAPARRAPRRALPLAARAAAALRRRWAACCSRSTTSCVGRADDPRTIVVGADVDREAIETFKAARGHEPNAEELAALRRVWLDNEVLYREGLALQVDKGDPAIRERVIFKALSVDRQQRQAAARRRQGAARLVREPPRQVRRAGPLRLRGGRAVRRQLRSRRARVREGAERRHAGRRQGRAARVQGPAAREPGAELRAGVRQGAGRIASRANGRPCRRATAGAPCGSTRSRRRSRRVFEVLRGVVLQDWTDATASEQRTRRRARADQEIQGEARSADARRDSE